MLRNYIVAAVRHLVRQRLFTVVNLVGMAVGMAGCVVIAVLIREELGFDRCHAKAQRIFRVLRESKPEGSHYIGLGTSGALGPAMAADFPQIEAVARVLGPRRVQLKWGDREIWRSLATADRAILDVFTLPMVLGDPATALADPANLVLTREAAGTLFGDAPPLGQTVSLFGQEDLRVTGVLEDIPANSTLRFEALRGVAAAEGGIWAEWRTVYSYRPIQTFLLLCDGADPDAMRSGLPAFASRHLGPRWASSVAFHLQPLTRVHLYSRQDYGLTDSRPDTETIDQATAFYGDVVHVWMFGAVAVLLLLVSVVNHVNLATARFAERTLEVGVRRSVGGQRGQVVSQLMGESILTAGLAMLSAVGVCELALPYLRQFTGLPLALDGAVLAGLVASAILVGAVAGWYPALLLSSAAPGRVLRGGLRTGPSGSRLRRGLVLLQFAVTGFLLVCAVVVTRQDRYLRDKPLGFDKAHVVIVPIFSADRSLVPRAGAVKAAFLHHPNVLSASGCAPHPGLGSERRLVFPEGEADRQWQMQILGIDESFLQTFAIELQAGRDLSPAEVRLPGSAYLLNETAVRQLGWEGTAVGRSFREVGSDQPGTVVGAVRDFHVGSLHHAVEPVALFGWTETWYLALRVRNEGLPETLAFLRQTWQGFVPRLPFSCYFLDERIDRMYRAENRLSAALAMFSGLAVAVACLGLLGMASHSAQCRRQEIGVRKAMGATAAQVVALLTAESARLVAVANLLAWPAGWWLMRAWLSRFPYRVEVGWVPFVLSAGVVMVAAVVTVSWRSLAAAAANPVDVLRHE